VKRILLYRLVMSGVFLAGSAMAAGEEGAFVSKCGSCHKKGGSAPSINPADKAGQVWEKFFERGRHPVDMGISDAELSGIVSYLKAHAADSDQPAVAVIPK